MSNDLLLILVTIIVGFALLYYLISKRTQAGSNDEALLEWLKSMQSTINTSSSETVKTLQENTRQLNDRLDKAAIVIKDVGREVGQMSEIGRNMRELQEFLKSPKLRGNIGEQVLKDLISQMFPKESFFLQYTF